MVAIKATERSTMQVVVIASQKGGIGKSMLAVHLATEATALGTRVLLLDLDSQRSAMSGHNGAAIVPRM